MHAMDSASRIYGYRGGTPKFSWGATERKFLGAICKKKKKGHKFAITKGVFLFFLKKIPGRTKVKNLTST